MDHATSNQATGTPTRMLRAGVIADMLDIPKARVYQFAREGRIPHVRVGASVRFDRQAIERWIEGGGTGQPGATT